MRGLGSNHVTGVGQLEASKKIAWKWDTHMDRLCDYQIESAKWADSIKIKVSGFKKEKIKVTSFLGKLNVGKGPRKTFHFFNLGFFENIKKLKFY